MIARACEIVVCYEHVDESPPEPRWGWLLVSAAVLAVLVIADAMWRWRKADR